MLPIYGGDHEREWTMSGSRHRQDLIDEAVRIDRALDNPKSKRVIDLRKIKVPGTTQSLFFVLESLVRNTNIESVLYALRDIQNKGGSK